MKEFCFSEHKFKQQQSNGPTPTILIWQTSLEAFRLLTHHRACTMETKGQREMAGSYSGTLL